jgi:hypothetical protein
MKKIIINVSTVMQEKSFDPHHYLGDEDAIKEDIEKREHEIFQKKQKLRLRHVDLDEDRARAARMARIARLKA